MSLEQNLDDKFKELNIIEEQQNKIRFYLNMLKEKDIQTYYHSIAVGLKMADAVDDKKAGLYCGILHDIGKLAIDDEILRKTEFTQDDLEKIKEHPVYGFLILGEEFAFSALAGALLHHQNQTKSYPCIKNLSTIIGSKNPESLEKAKQYAKILHVIDDKDAKEHRRNNYREQ